MLQGITHVQLGMEWENQKKPLLQYLYTVGCVTLTFGESTKNYPMFDSDNFMITPFL